MIVEPTPAEVEAFTDRKGPKEVLKKIILRVWPDGRAHLDGTVGTGLSGALHGAALYCFREGLTGPDVEEIRRQCKHLADKGELDLETGPGYYIYEVRGSNLYRVPPEHPPIEWNSWSDIEKYTQGDAFLVTTQEGLVSGDRVVFQALFGWVWGTVRVSDSGTYAERLGSMYILDFVDDRPGDALPRWVCLGQFNARAIERLSLET